MYMQMNLLKLIGKALKYSGGKIWYLLEKLWWLIKAIGELLNIVKSGVAVFIIMLVYQNYENILDYLRKIIDLLDALPI